ncbi:MAG: ComF family protein [Elusimicrobiales bacterium]
MSFLKHFVNILFPKICLSCRCDLEAERDHPLCLRCERELIMIEFPYCRLCGAYLKGGGELCYSCKGKRFNFDFSRSVFIYNLQISSVIKACKYSSKDYLALWMGKIMAERFSYYKEFLEYESVTYVPVSLAKLRERGFNHSELIASVFSNLLGLSFIKDAIWSSKTISQLELSAQERRNNVNGKFKVIRDVFKNKSVIVVDDVATTMSTLDEISRVIKEAQAKRVCCFTVAREQK